MQPFQNHLRAIVLQLIKASDELIRFYKGHGMREHYAIIKIRDELAMLIENRKV